MEKTVLLLLAACVLLSGCGRGMPDSEETVEETEAVWEGTENGSESMVEICTGIEREILERDDAFDQADLLDAYLDGREFALIKLVCPGAYRGHRLYREDESRDWGEEDWDLVRPLGQATTYAEGYGKIDYNNDGRKEYVYRTVENGMAASGYEVSEDGKSITGAYDLLDVFAPSYDEEKIPLQLWFWDTGDVVVSLSLLENTETDFTLYAFLVEGDHVSLLEKRMLTAVTKEVPESRAYSAENIYASQSGLWKFSVEDFEAYDLSEEELKSLRQDREIQIEEQETGLPGELVEVLQNILTGTGREEGLLPEDLLELYEAKDCKLDDGYAFELLRDSDSDLIEVMDAYRADLDGDGKEEIIMRSYCGGNGLAKPIEIWRESGDGTGRYVQEEIGGASGAMLLFMDGNYYYVTRIYAHYLASSIWRVYSFSGDGEVKAGKFALEPQGTGMSWTKYYENAAMDPRILQEIQDYIESRKTEIEKGDEILQGQAEEEYLGSGYDFLLEAFDLSRYASDCRIVDFDNDGEMECCMRQVLQNGSSAGGPDILYYEIMKKQGDYVCQLESVFQDDSFPEPADSYTWQLWFEEFGGKTYIFRQEILDGSLDGILYVELIQGNKRCPVLNYFLLDHKVCRYERERGLIG